MTIALSNPRRSWGGASTMTVLLAEGLQARGEEVVVLCRRASPLHRRLEGVVPVEPVLAGRDLPLPSIARTVRALRRHRAKVLLSSTVTDLRFTPPAAALLRIPVVARRVALFPMSDDGIAERWIWRHLVDHVVANSNATRDVLLESADWLEPVDVTVIHNGIDVERFASATPVDRAELRVPRDALVIGFVGRLSIEKGLPDLAAAWRTVAEAMRDAHLVVVGDGGQRKAFEAAIGSHPRVRFLGFRADVPALLKTFDIFVLPSHSEAFGLAAAEAMAAGVPVVATRVGGLPEVIEDGRTGVLVPPHYPERLAEALVALARDPARRQALARAGRDEVARRFGHESVVDAYHALLKRWSR